MITSPASGAKVDTSAELKITVAIKNIELGSFSDAATQYRINTLEQQ